VVHMLLIGVPIALSVQRALVHYGPGNRNPR
jgi:hypothetical protein